VRSGRPKRQLWRPGMRRSPECDVVALSVRRREGVVSGRAAGDEFALQRAHLRLARWACIRRVLEAGVPEAMRPLFGPAHFSVPSSCRITLLAGVPVRPLSRNPVLGHYSR
jgi:hypothetical protein